jgi:hypothetical protein
MLTIFFYLYLKLPTFFTNISFVRKKVLFNETIISYNFCTYYTCLDIHIIVDSRLDESGLKKMPKNAPKNVEKN